MRALALVLASSLSLAAAAADKSESTSFSDKLKAAASSESGKNAQAKALSKIGMDVTASPAGAKTYFISPKDGDTVSSPVKVVFGLSGMGVAPAGVQKDNTGHFHLLIDDPAVDTTKPLPSKNAQIVHYGNGQTEAEVKLAPGKHTLQILLGDWKHQPHNPVVESDKITVTVK